jgi:hypothetical protein
MSTILGVLKGTCGSPTSTLLPRPGPRPSAAFFPAPGTLVEGAGSGSDAAYDAFADHVNQLVMREWALTRARPLRLDNEPLTVAAPLFPQRIPCVVIAG